MYVDYHNNEMLDNCVMCIILHFSKQSSFLSGITPVLLGKSQTRKKRPAAKLTTRNHGQLLFQKGRQNLSGHLHIIGHKKIK